MSFSDDCGHFGANLMSGSVFKLVTMWNLKLYQ